MAIAAMAEETDRRPTSVAAACEQAATGALEVSSSITGVTQAAGERLRQSETGRAEGGNLLVQVRAT